PPPEIQPEFHEEQTPPPQKKIAQKTQPIKAPQVAGPPKPPGMMSASQAKAAAISAPRPDYPYEARSRKITGSGVCVVTVDTASGSVTDATMAQSIGNPILDNSAVSAFRRWRFKPGTVSKVRIPITFTMTGASYYAAKHVLIMHVGSPILKQRARIVIITLIDMMLFLLASFLMVSLR